MMLHVQPRERESYHYFVFRKGQRVPTDRFDTPEAAHAALAALAAAQPGHTFILAREIVRAKAVEVSHG